MTFRKAFFWPIGPGSNLVYCALNHSAPSCTSSGWCGAWFGACTEPAPWFGAWCGKKCLWTTLNRTPASLHLDALSKGSAENAQSPLYTVGLRYIKCPFLRFGPDNINHPFLRFDPDNINHPFLRFSPDNINHPFLRFSPDISTTLCYVLAEIN